MSRASSLAIAALAIATRSPLAQAQAGDRKLPTGTIDGVVTDSARAPLGDVTVSILGSSVKVVSGSNGRFRVRDLIPGSYTLIARRIGFEAGGLRVDLSPGDTIRPALTLRRLATALDTIRVQSWDVTGFAWRRSLNVGQFITVADIDRENPRTTTSLIRTRDAMRYTFDKMGNPFVAMSAGAKRRGNCRPFVFLDGFPIPGGSVPRVTGVPSLDWALHPDEIGGVEIYVNPSQVPPQFRSFVGEDPECGVVVFWTRARLGIPPKLQTSPP